MPNYIIRTTTKKNLDESKNNDVNGRKPGRP